MASRNVNPGRLFRSPPADLETQSRVAKELGVDWTNFARAAFGVFTGAKIIPVTHAGRVRKRSFPFDVYALIVCGDGGPYFLQRKRTSLASSECCFEPVRVLSASFELRGLRYQDFQNPKLVKQLLDESTYQAFVKPTKGAK